MSTREAALELAKLGWRVIPIFWVVEDPGTGKFMCGCGNPLCTAPGKHPLMKMGKNLANASSDLRVVTDWWNAWPNANLAVACGLESRIAVIDCDTAKTSEFGGEYEFMSWCAGRNIDTNALLTMTASTGGAGKHYIFQYPADGIPLKNCVGWLEDVDVKSDGGYILVAPSVHVSGKAYEWRNLISPAPFPPEIAQAIRLTKSGGLRKGRAGEDINEVGDEKAYDYREAVLHGAKKGSRDDAFNSRAFELRKLGKDWEEAKADLWRMWNSSDVHGDDPFPWDSVLTKLKNIWADDEIKPEPNPTWTAIISGETVTVESTPRIILEGQPQDLFTDRGNAWQLLHLHRDSLKHTSALGWMVWDGSRWVKDQNEAVMEFAGRTADHIRDTAPLKYEDLDTRDAAIKWATYSQGAQKITGMVRMTATYSGHKAKLEDFDQNPWLLTVPNGTIELKTGELRPSSRHDMITMMSRVQYVPDAQDPMWDEYLLEACNGDTELIAYLQRAAGYSLTGSASEEVMFFIYGPKASGKSTFVKAMTTVLGDYALSTQPENLMHRANKSIPKDEIARMRGMRLVTAVEPQRGDRFAEGLLKQMTGGDKMSGRFLYKDTFEFEPTHKLWIASNTKPRAGDDALFRRLKLLPFPVTVPFERRNHNLKLFLEDKNSSLAQAAFAWAVQGCLQWQEYGLGTAMVVEQETRQYQEDEDIVGQFINECVDPDSAVTDRATAKEVHAVYSDWAHERGDNPMKLQSLNKALEEKGFKRVSISGDRSVAFGKIKLLRATWSGVGSV